MCACGCGWACVCECVCVCALVYMAQLPKTKYLMQICTCARACAHACMSECVGVRAAFVRVRVQGRGPDTCVDGYAGRRDGCV